MKKVSKTLLSNLFFLVFFLVFNQSCLQPVSKPEFRLSVTGENCFITVSPKKEIYCDGETVHLDAYPDTGYAFTTWQGIPGSTHTVQFQINSNLTVKGICQENTEKMAWVKNNKPGLTTSVDQLQEYTGGNATTKDGQIFENLIISKRIYINHADVLFRNCLLKLNTTDTVALYVAKPGDRPPQGGVNLTLEHCELMDGVHYSESFTVRNCMIHPYPGKYRNDGFCFAADNVLIEGNLIDGLNGSSGAHLDGIQIMAGSNITLRNNWIESFSHDKITGGGMITSAIIIKPNLGHITNLNIDGNMLLQDPTNAYFPLRIYTDVGTFKTQGIINVTNNRWDFQNHGLLGAYQIDKGISIAKWENNTYNNGTIIPFE